MRISETMSKFPLITDRKMPVKNAHNFMLECGIRHLPVLQETQLVGVVSERDLRAAVNLDQSSLICVEDVMHDEPYAILGTTSVADVAKTMASEKLGSAIIVDTQNQVVGIFTTTDALRILADLLDQSGGQKYQSITVEEYTSEPYLRTV